MPSLYETITTHLMQPENRIKYCYHFMDNFEDYPMKELAFRKAMHWISVCEDEGSDF